MTSIVISHPEPKRRSNSVVEQAAALAESASAAGLLPVIRQQHRRQRTANEVLLKSVNSSADMEDEIEQAGLGSTGPVPPSGSRELLEKHSFRKRIRITASYSPTAVSLPILLGKALDQCVHALAARLANCRMRLVA